MDLDALEKKRYKEYKSIKKVYCPILDCNVHFNYKGWRHMRYKANTHTRVSNDLARRFSLFPQAKRIISSKKCGVRAESGNKFINIYLEKGKITVMLRRKIGSKVAYYYSIWDS